MTDPSSYLLLDRIAAGGMAEVYRAKSLGVEGFERIVAMKRILPALADDAEFVSMFISEAKIAGQLNHANIVPILELGKIGGTHFIAMEYVWGKDLRRILARFKMIGQPMPPPMAAWIMMKVLEGLDYAHRKRGVDGRPLAIIHRDISPQNVLVSYDGLVKLIDFGIAKAASRATQTQAGVIKGKLAYMSPEQVVGLPLDHRSDVFAASAVLHELLTGEAVFRGASDIDVIDKVREARAEPPSASAPHVPPQLDAIVMKGLARDVADRWQTAGDMQDAIMRFIAVTRPPYSTSELGKWMRVAFASDISKERAHLDQLTALKQAGARVAPERATPDPAGSRPSIVPGEELSQIVTVEELSLDISSPSIAARTSEPPAPLAPAAYGAAPPSASSRGVASSPGVASGVASSPGIASSPGVASGVASSPGVASGVASSPGVASGVASSPGIASSPGAAWAASSAGPSAPGYGSTSDAPAPGYGGYDAAPGHAPGHGGYDAAPSHAPGHGGYAPAPSPADSPAYAPAPSPAYAPAPSPPYTPGSAPGFGPGSFPGPGPGYAASLPPADQPAPASRSRLPLVVAAVFLLGTIGGALAWVFLFGGRAALGF